MKAALSFLALLLLAAPDPGVAPPASAGGVGFGSALVLDGDRILVGQPSTAPGFPLPPSEAGAVHLFAPGSGGGWDPAGSLVPPDAEVGGEFGAALALSGDLLAVGAPSVGGARGEVHLFRRTGAGWTHEARVRLSDARPEDRFGSVLAVHGGVVLAAAPGRDGATGTVAVLRRDEAGSWGEEARLAGEGGRAGDLFGTSLTFDGELALVGAPGPVAAPTGPEAMFSEGGPGPRAGRVLVFHRDGGGAWSPAGTLDAPEGSTGAFGASLLAGESDLLVGATGSMGGAGAVHHFRRDGDQWRPVATLTPATPAPGSSFGISLAGAGNDVFVGAPLALASVGQVVVFRRDGDAWSELQSLTIPGRGIMTQFGFAVAAADGRAVVGGPMADFFVGAGYVYGPDAAANWRLEGEVFHEGEGLPALMGDEIRCEEGQAHLFACDEVDLLSFLPVRELGGGRGIMVNDMWGWTHEESGREFAIVGRLDGTVFIEVTDPQNPRYLGELPLTDGAEPNLWRDIKVYRGHAYIVADAAGPHGMQVFDLHQLLEVDPAEAPLLFEATAHYDRVYSAHNVVINEDSGFAYIVGGSMGGETCGGALHMVDIRDPLNPTFAGCFGDPSTGFAGTGYTHDAQCVIYGGPDERFHGREICFNASENALGIADVTDKENPVRLGSASYPNVAYAHQGWLTEDQRYFYLNDEGDELAGTVETTRTLIFDVADLEDPVVAGEYMGTTPASDHNLYIRGDLMYQSNYVAGLQIIDISEPLNPRQVGAFRTVPAGEITAGFLGSWSNYPFFRSGAVGVTSMREGFFMVRFRDARMVP
jgi:choice-of-anchor B domain-containing protein